MEFRFDLKSIFKNEISRIGNSLLPAGFVAQDRRAALDATSIVAEIINTIGQASAHAQGLNTAVTNAERIRNSEDQVIYIMTEENDKNGLVVGILKIGHKSLYVFDKYGDTKHVVAPCVLDFYVHESRQRHGLGKIMFEHMLEHENLLPEQLAVDRPSEKLLGFLRKHYALTQKIPQMNNFVIYDGFFAAHQSEKENPIKGSQMHIAASVNSNLFGPQYITDNDHHGSQSKTRARMPEHSVNFDVHSQALGRYGAKRPICSLNQIIHNKPTVDQSEPNSTTFYNNSIGEIIKDNNINNLNDIINHDETDNQQSVEELAHDMHTLDIEHVPASPSPSVSPEHVKFATDGVTDNVGGGGISYYQQPNDFYDCSSGHPQEHEHSYRQQHDSSPTPYHYNKKQTGKKNQSSNVGLAVNGQDEKIEFDQHNDIGFGCVKINRPIGVSSRSNTNENLNDNESVDSRDSEHTHTDQGYLDLKFHHSRLW
ncbi:unnamed protein product [Diamesa tonsa]